jgi:uncharacterized protein
VNLPQPRQNEVSESLISEKIDDLKTIATETGIEAPDATPETVIHEKLPSAAKTVYLIIDDVGNSLINLELFLGLDMPITYAILPDRAFSRESLSRINAHGQSAILHQPMEPEGQGDPGTGAIVTGMSKSEIHKVLEDNLSGLKGIQGINNHMGSRTTSDPTVMHTIMEYLSSNDLFFLDSVTTSKSVAGDSAKAFNVPFARRNGVFLDNESEYDAILKNWELGLQVAKNDGAVVLIGHVQSKALVSVIRNTVSELIRKGYTFKHLIEYPALAQS